MSYIFFMPNQFLVKCCNIYEALKITCRSNKYFTIHFAISISRFELGSPSISYMVMGTTNQFSTRARLEEVRKHKLSF